MKRLLAREIVLDYITSLNTPVFVTVKVLCRNIPTLSPSHARKVLNRLVADNLIACSLAKTPSGAKVYHDVAIIDTYKGND